MKRALAGAMGMILVLAAVSAPQAVGYTYTSLVDYPGGSGVMHAFGWL